MGATGRSLLVAALVTTSVGCADQAVNDDRLSRVEAQLEIMSAQLDAANNRIEVLEQSVSTLRTQVIDLRANEILDTVAYLTPADSGYDSVHTQLGTVLFKIHDVQPFASGSRVTLRVANLTGIAFTDMRMKLSYSATDTAAPDTLPEPRVKDHEILALFRHGIWQFHTITLDGVAPDRLATLNISEVVPQTVSLAEMPQ